jgi:hypothetical protein
MKKNQPPAPGKSTSPHTEDAREVNISCQYLHFARTEDIGLKSAVFGRNPMAMITGRNIDLWGQIFNLDFA